MKRFTSALAQAGIEYRLIGGMAVMLHVRDRDTMAARLTNDIDAAVQRTDLQAVIRAVEPFGFTHRRIAGADTLVDPAKPTARSAIHLVFAGEKFRKEYSEPVPFSPPAKTIEGALIAPVADWYA